MWLNKKKVINYFKNSYRKMKKHEDEETYTKYEYLGLSYVEKYFIIF